MKRRTGVKWMWIRGTGIFVGLVVWAVWLRACVGTV